MRIVLFICLAFLVIETTFSQEINQFDTNGKRHGVWQKKHKGSNVLRYEGTFDHGKEVGVFMFYKKIKGKQVLTATRDFSTNDGLAQVTFYSSKKKVISEGKMRGKVYVGVWRYYQRNSDKLLIKEAFNDNGELEGERFVYYKNGNVAEKQFYKAGKLHGSSFWYALNKVVLKEFNYVNGELHGVSKYYNPKGQLIVEGQYRKDKKHGFWKYYKNGELVETKDFTIYGKYNPKKKAP